jgi:hypothetical protein
MTRKCHRLLICAALVLVGGTGCGKRDPSSQREPRLSLQRRNAERSRDAARLRLTPREDRGIEVQSYAFSGKFDWDRLRLSASVAIDLTITAHHIDHVTLDNQTDVSSVTDGHGAIPFHQNTDGTLTLDTGGNQGDQRHLILQYEASGIRFGTADPTGLIAIPPRKGDPVPSRALATFSEPQGAGTWMPCNDFPTDRALFSAEFEMAADESLVSNGDLVLDEVRDGIHRMRYATRYPLPNYLMAIAVGQFDRATASHGGLPLALWTRKGLPVDAAGVLREMDRDLTAYERLLPPYPFEKYNLILLPQYMGGEEHAGIIFQGETSSTRADLPGDFELTAHELGHQWFGDLVTISTWDDLWIKEGMATLMAAEATRFFTDRNQRGPLFAGQFDLADGDAILDPGLAPDKKYTTGPYGRSAWTFTQVRSLIGEPAFWGTWNRILRKYAFRSIGTEEILAEFQPVLGAELTAQWRAALVSKRLPALSTAPAGTGGGTVVTVADPDQTLLAPIEARWHDGGGKTEASFLDRTHPLTIPATAAGLLELDPQDRQALTMFPGAPEAFANALGPVLSPRNPEQLEAFLDEESASSQALALWQGTDWQLQVEDFNSIINRLGSFPARYAAIKRGCRTAVGSKRPRARLEWQPALRAALQTQPWLGLPQQLDGIGGLGECAAAIGADFLAATWAGIAAHPADPAWNESLLYFVLLISADTETIFRASTQLATAGLSVRERAQGLTQLARHLQAQDGFSAPTPEQKTHWEQFLKDELASVEADELTTPIQQALAAAGLKAR